MVLTKLATRSHKMGKRKSNQEDNGMKKSKNEKKNDLKKDEAEDLVPKASTSKSSVSERNSSDVEDKTRMVKTVEGIALGYFGLTS